MRLARWMGALVASTAALAAGHQTPDPKPNLEQEHAVAGNNEFALGLYARLCRDHGNLFLAPYSARTALVMTWAGARGRTATQMADVLHVSGAGAHRALGQLARGVQSDGAEGSPILHVANALWAQAGEPILSSFTALCAEHYGAAVSPVDFATAPEAARRTINTWVAEQTSGRIPELVREDVLDASTVLVLTNAIDFQGTWQHAFDPARTTERPFFLLPSDDVAAAGEVTVPTMQMSASVGYYEDELVQLVELPYSSWPRAATKVAAPRFARGDPRHSAPTTVLAGQLAMTIVLPRARDGLPALERELARESLDTWLAAMRPRSVEVHLPRFQTRSRLELDAHLAALGMPDAFDGDVADFSGINGRRNLSVDAVVHEAAVRVDERGTEAAGATAVMMTKGGPRASTFRADHPFLFLIRDRHTGTILFLGRLAEPTNA